MIINAAILFDISKCYNIRPPLRADERLVVRGCLSLLGQQVRLRLGRASAWRGNTTVPLIRSQPTYMRAEARHLAHSTQFSNQHTLPASLAMCDPLFSLFFEPEVSGFGPQMAEQDPNFYSIESSITPYDQYADRADSIDPAVLFSTYNAVAYRPDAPRRALNIPNQPSEPYFGSTDE